MELSIKASIIMARDKGKETSNIKSSLEKIAIKGNFWTTSHMEKARSFTGQRMDQENLQALSRMDTGTGMAS